MVRCQFYLKYLYKLNIKNWTSHGAHSFLLASVIPTDPSAASQQARLNQTCLIPQIFTVMITGVKKCQSKQKRILVLSELPWQSSVLGFCGCIPFFGELRYHITSIFLSWLFIAGVYLSSVESEELDMKRRHQFLFPSKCTVQMPTCILGKIKELFEH